MWAVVASLVNKIFFMRPLLSRVVRMLARGTRKLLQNCKRINFLCSVRDRFLTARGGMICPGVYVQAPNVYTKEQN